MTAPLMFYRLSCSIKEMNCLPFVTPDFLKQLYLDLLNLKQPIVLAPQEMIEFLVQMPDLQLGL
jgi:hypothetical protein